MQNRPVIAVVDDDESVRESLPDLLSEMGFASETFSSAADFLASACLEQVSCLLLDVAMPGMTGLDLQRELKVRGSQLPIIFITAHKDDCIRPKVVGEGAVECLPKPFSDSALLDALNVALRPT